MEFFMHKIETILFGIAIILFGIASALVSNFFYLGGVFEIFAILAPIGGLIICVIGLFDKGYSADDTNDENDAN
jgi:hypothetical protein